MTYLMSAVLGFLQGVAEFLPISSSGHLSLFQHFFGMEEPDSLFNILLHFATLIAVCVYYFQDVMEMIVEFFRGVAALFSRTPSRGNPPEGRRLVLLVIVGTLPLFAVLPVESKIEMLGGSPVFVSCALLVTGCVLFLSDRYGGGRKTAKNATIKDALLVGLAQGVATIHGNGLSAEVCSALLLPAVPSCCLWRHAAEGHQDHKGGGASGRGDSAQVSAGHGRCRSGRLLFHSSGGPAGVQGQVWRLCLVLLGSRPAFLGAEPCGLDTVRQDSFISEV